MTAFLKWAGGKNHFLSEILFEIPKETHFYYEPFIGAGSVFFALAEDKRFQYASINDANSELIATYRVVKYFIKDLIQKLESWQPHALDEVFFYKLREEGLNCDDPIVHAARMIFLNHTCFNGLYRVNKKGKFNVPFGRYVKPNVCNKEMLLKCHHLLDQVSIDNEDFESFLDSYYISEGTTIYFDPPYIPLKEDSFVAYDKQGFSIEDHKRLANVFKECVNKGAKCILSNSDTSLSRELYKSFKIKQVMARRNINSKGSQRGKIPEILVVS